MPKGSDLFVTALENEGVDRIFGVPGEENLDLLESLRTSSIKLILTRHEQAAAFMAAITPAIILVGTSSNGDVPKPTRKPSKRRTGALSLAPATKVPCVEPRSSM